jgi:phospholipid-binding lipoprotein MlaA
MNALSTLKAGSHLAKMLMLGACLMAVSGCAAPHGVKAPDASQADADPLESVNRAIYKFNFEADRFVLKPVTVGYRTVVPEKGREMVTNFLANIYTPVTFANSVLQRDPQNSFASLWRFILNTTFGGAGLFDFASAAGLKNRPADLGETFAMYGVGPGPYVVLPIIGPSNVRDAFGRLGDAFINPFNYLGNDVSTVLWSATAIDQRSANMQLLDDIYSSSLDPYSTFRSGYTQKRAATIRRATISRNKALERGMCK